MLTSRAARRSPAPFLALPSTSVRGHKRSIRPLAPREPWRPKSQPHRGGPTAHPGPRAHRGPPMYQQAPMMGDPYGAPPQTYGAPTQWSGPAPPGWTPPAYYSSPQYQIQSYPPHERQTSPPHDRPRYPSHQQQGYPPHEQGYPTHEQQGYPPQKQQRYPPPEQQRYSSAQDPLSPGPRKRVVDRSDDFPKQYPSFRFKAPNFYQELRIAASPTKLYFGAFFLPYCEYATDAVSIRDKCNCSKCRDPSSSQKTFRSSEIPLDLKISNVAAAEEGLRITFANDIPRLAEADGSHVTVFPWSQLEPLGRWKKKVPLNARNMYAVQQRTGIVPWDRETITDQVRSIDYEDYIKGEDAMWDVVTDLVRYGIVFLRNVPEDPEAVKRIANTIAQIQTTFYGETFDVRAKPNAENVAYTSDYLGLHQDLLYLKSPPHIQILHCLENSCKGGESLFCDGDRIGRLLSLFAHNDSVQALINREMTYGYDANGFYYSRNREGTINLVKGIFRNLWWSPPFESQHEAPNVTAQTIRGTRILETLLNEPESVYERKMNPGECVLFDNMRVMHGRKAFDAQGGGSRWLRGAYISGEDFKSKACHLPEGYPEATRPSSHVDLENRHRTAGRALLQESLRNTPWFNHVKELIQKDEEEQNAIQMQRMRDLNSPRGLPAQEQQTIDPGLPR